MNTTGRIMVRYCPPRFGKPVEIWFDVDDFTAEPFQPLPRARELYDQPVISAAFSGLQRQQARDQLADRAKLTEYLVPRLTKALVDAITSQDTINGYKPEELER